MEMLKVQGVVRTKERCRAQKKMIKENIGTLPARSIVHKVINERGGIMKIGSSGALPRNRTQVYNITREVKKQKEPLTHIEDPMLKVLAKAKEEQQGRDEDIFIREIPLFPEPIVFIANKQQLVDIERFCMNPFLHELRIRRRCDIPNCLVLLHLYDLQKFDANYEER